VFLALRSDQTSAGRATGAGPAAPRRSPLSRRLIEALASGCLPLRGQTDGLALGCGQDSEIFVGSASPPRLRLAHRRTDEAVPLSAALACNWLSGASGPGRSSADFQDPGGAYPAEKIPAPRTHCRL